MPRVINDGIIISQVEHARRQGWLPYFEDAAREHDVLMSVLMAIASHETNMGLSPHLVNWRGDHGHGRGLMQIDDRSHKPYVATHRDDDHRANIRYGAKVLKQNLRHKRARGRYEIAVPAYNAGMGGVIRALDAGRTADSATTPGDYGQDVLIRARYFNEVLDLGEQLGPFEYGAPDPDYANPARYGVGTGEPDVLDALSILNFGDLPEEDLTDLTRALAVLEGEESRLLDEMPAPGPGEFDIGDIRFGSPLFDELTRSFRSIDDPRLNQPTSVTQQNVGAVGVVELLRTDMNPVIGDNRTLPEVSIQLTLNATYRDDVNRVLRPLIAQMKRMPFLPVRNADVARLMLGIGTNRTVAQYFEEENPQLYDYYKESGQLEELESLDASELWVPCTLRSTQIASQPGAKDLFQVTLVVQLANILPYVPRMTFWRTTREAVDWARYLSYRSEQGSVVVDADEGQAKVLTSDGKFITIATPRSLSSGQIESPHESYVYKKFYRGLLEEWQGGESYGLYRYYRDRGELTRIEPLGTHGGEAVYEPAYPISDPVRLFEEYDPRTIMGLGYVTASSQTSRKARTERLNRAFSSWISEIRLLQNVGRAFGRRGRLNDTNALGDVGFLEFGLGKDIHLMMATMGYTLKELNSAVTRAVNLARGQNADLMVPVYQIEVDGHTVRLVGEDSTLEIPPESITLSLVRGARFLNDAAGFHVNDPTNQGLSIRFRDAARKPYMQIVQRLALILRGLEEEYGYTAVSAGTGGSGILINNTEADQRRRVQAEGFFKTIREITALLDENDDVDVKDLLSSIGLRPPQQKAIAALSGEQFLRSTEFLALLEAQPWINEESEHLEALRQLIEDVAGLNRALYDVMQQEKSQRAERYLSGGNRIERGFLNFEESTVESIRVSFSQRFGDREWDGYPYPVSQHIGGSGAEVTLQVTTNDETFLTQLSELKQSQIALNELKKRHDFTPPLIDIFGQGCLLRSLGVKQLAYRSHTIFEVKDAPGYYQIRLDLIQDESTLVRMERYRRIAGAVGQNLFDTYELSPLFTSTQAKDLTPKHVFATAAPLALRELLRRVYDRGGPVDAVQDYSKFNDEGLLPAHTYKEFEDLTARDLPHDVQVRYVSKEHRHKKGRVFDVVVSGYDERQRPESRPVDLDAVLAPIGSFLDYAHQAFPEDDANFPRDLGLARLTGAVEQALSTTGHNQGFVAGLLHMSLLILQDASSLIDQAADRRAAANASTNKGRDADFLAGNRRIARELEATPVRDNLSYILGRLLQNDRELPAAITSSAIGILTAVDDLGHTLIANTVYRHLYADWMRQIAIPGGKAIEATAEDDGIFHWAPILEGPPGEDGDATPGSLEKLAALMREIQQSVPTCYPDLLMPELRDPTQMANLIGYDFPFGPGAENLADDALVANYEEAEQMRIAAAVQLASTGLGVIAHHLSEDPEDPALGLDLGGERALEYGGARAANQRLAQVLHEARRAAENGQLAEARRLEDELIDGLGGTDLGQAYGEAVQHLNSQRGDLTQDLGRLRNLGLFTGLPLAGQRTMTSQNWADLYRIAQTLKYTSYAVELARESGAPFKEAFEKIDTLSAPLALDAASTSVEVQQDPQLRQMKDRLVWLYRSDPVTIAKSIGFTDLSSEPYRQMLQDKIRAQWSRWIGMRRAFPSYSLLITGPVGSSFFRVLADVYSWTAVQQIEIRDQAKSAGQYAELVLSNMRNRLTDPLDRQNYLVSTDEFEDLAIEITHGTHMNIFVGYGPDQQHLRGMAGRVTDFQPGPVTSITVSSYSATLSNAPNKGRGFITSAATGTSGLADTAIFALSQTEGLEGLGRGSFGNIRDALNRTSRGGEMDTYKASILLYWWRNLFSKAAGNAVMPGSDELKKELNRFTQIADQLGLKGFEQVVVGSPKLFENIQLAASPLREVGAWQFLLGTLPERLTEGDGWKWIAQPGETCFAVLNDIAKLFPDYIATTRPYNTGVPLHQIDDHPLRQTVYLGPRHGYYAATDLDRRVSTQARDYIRGNLDSLLGEHLGREVSGEERLEEYRKLYMDIFYQGFAFVRLLETIQDRKKAWYQSLLESINFFTDDMQTSWEVLWNGIERSLEVQNGLQNISLQPDDRRRFITEIHTAFPKTVEALGLNVPETHLVNNVLNYTIWQANPLRGLEVELMKWSPIALLAEMAIPPDYLSGENKHRAQVILQAFKDDLAQLATEGQMYENLRGASGYGSHSNALVSFLQNRAKALGLVVEARMRPIVEHHPISIYTELATNGLVASDSDPDFANQVTLLFPSSPGERDGVLRGENDPNAFTIQANPLIHPDFLVNDTVFFPNVHLDWHDMATLASAQIGEIGGQMGPIALVKRLRTVTEEFIEVTAAEEEGAVQASDRLKLIGGGDVPITNLIKALEKETKRIQTELAGTPYVKPKYQTVGTNVLQDRIRHMYQGELILGGDPRILPHHIVHFFDDAKLMHGPVEVDGVYHRFGPDGFHTVLQPRLVTFHRGIDQTLDTQWLNQTSQFYHTLQLFTRYLGAGFGVASAIGGTGLWLTGAAASGKGLTFTGLNALGGAIGTAAGGAALATTGLLAIVAAAWWSASIGKDAARYHAAIIGDIANTNPIIFLPVTHKSKALVAGLEGAAGPGTIVGGFADALALAQKEGRLPYLNDWFESYYSSRTLEENAS